MKFKVKFEGYIMDRTAIASIKGYFYQFDYSMLCALELKEDTVQLTVESIEDVEITDFHSKTTIQCKYYAGTDYNHSIISEPYMEV